MVKKKVYAEHTKDWLLHYNLLKLPPWKKLSVTLGFSCVGRDAWAWLNMTQGKAEQVNWLNQESNNLMLFRINKLISDLRQFIRTATFMLPESARWIPQGYDVLRYCVTSLIYKNLPKRRTRLRNFFWFKNRNFSSRFQKIIRAVQSDRTTADDEDICFHVGRLQVTGWIRLSQSRLTKLRLSRY